MVTIALDIMGGDRGPHVFLPAIKRALNTHSQLHFIICGDSAAVSNIVDDLNQSEQKRIATRICSQVVDMRTKPTDALRTLTDSSMRVAIALVQSQEANGCVSCGNTGALMAMAYSVLKPIPGIPRPAFVSA